MLNKFLKLTILNLEFIILIKFVSYCGHIAISLHVLVASHNDLDPMFQNALQLYHSGWIRQEEDAAPYADLIIEMRVGFGGVILSFVIICVNVFPPYSFHFLRPEDGECNICWNFRTFKTFLSLGFRSQKFKT